MHHLGVKTNYNHMCLKNTLWYRKRDQLTGQSRAHEAVSVGRIALPLLAALSWHLDPSRHGAVGAGQAHVHGAKRYTAHGSIQTGTLVLAAALESLSALVHHASEHTGGSISSCGGNDKGKVTIRFVHLGRLRQAAVTMHSREKVLIFHDSPVHTPMRLLMGAPKSQ